MKQYQFIRISFFYSVSDCEWNSHSDNKHEERLYQIPKVQSMPFMMAELGTKKLHYTITFNGTDVVIKPGAFTNQKKHSNTTKKIYRCNSSYYCRSSIILNFIHCN